MEEPGVESDTETDWLTKNELEAGEKTGVAAGLEAPPL
jgi:hypothetical protein